MVLQVILILPSGTQRNINRVGSLDRSDTYSLDAVLTAEPTLSRKLTSSSPPESGNSAKRAQLSQYSR
ncbi:hypothetical protein WN944_013988 [Citrus x changshan-huyou]|uniref:Uncharacterized protein n=1 Tax=Citrus x changshan-huyou TaxID=2935761 RepID=A0AAP0QPM4_9ROSI